MRRRHERVIRALALAAALAAASLASGPARAGEMNDLATGAVHRVDPDDTDCFSSAFGDTSSPVGPCPIRAGAQCRDDGEASLSIISCLTLLGAEAGSHAHYQYWPASASRSSLRCSRSATASKRATRRDLSAART